MPNRLEDVGGELGLLQNRRQLLDRALDAGVQLEPGYRQLPGAFEIGQRHGARLELGVEHGTAPHFLPVVILGFHPEDGDGRHILLAFGPASQLQGSERLQQRVDRSAKHAGLLTGDDGD